jgi:hypothetical protein
MRNAYKILEGKPEWKRPLGRPRQRREYQNGSYGNTVGGFGLDEYGLG